MKVLMIITALLSSSLQASVIEIYEQLPENLNELYQTMDEVPFLHEQNRLTNYYKTADFKKESFHDYIPEHGSIVYTARIPSVECEEFDVLRVSLTFHAGELKFALPMRSFGCHED